MLIEIFHFLCSSENVYMRHAYISLQHVPITIRLNGLANIGWLSSWHYAYVCTALFAYLRFVLELQSAVLSLCKCSEYSIQ